MLHATAEPRGRPVASSMYCIRRNIRCVLITAKYLRGHPLTANINTSVNLIHNDKGG